VGEKWKSVGVGVLLPASIYLAPERNRLWNALERFVNCGDELDQFQALGRGFSTYSPVQIWVSGMNGSPSPWHPACHELFLFYRDSLRTLWRGRAKLGTRGMRGFPHMRLMKNALFSDTCEYLAGISDLNAEAFKVSSERSSHVPSELARAADTVLRAFPTARVHKPITTAMIWEYGCLVPMLLNDFQRAFYLLFLESWRARICPECQVMFVARKPSSKYCGTSCSATAGLAARAKWWNSTGTKRRKERTLLAKKRTRAKKLRARSRQSRRRKSATVGSVLR
jgi:hypothetical protein